MAADLTISGKPYGLLGSPILPPMLVTDYRLVATCRGQRSISSNSKFFTHTYFRTFSKISWSTKKSARFTKFSCMIFAIRKLKFSECFIEDPRQFAHLRNAMQQIDFEISPNLEEVQIG